MLALATNPFSEMRGLEHGKRVIQALLGGETETTALIGDLGSLVQILRTDYRDPCTIPSSAPNSEVNRVLFELDFSDGKKVAIIAPRTPGGDPFSFKMRIYIDHGSGNVREITLPSQKEEVHIGALGRLEDLLKHAEPTLGEWVSVQGVR